ncbi:AbrB/MazE/SpoVT family DNA-binding domain-containing protein [Amphibacillus indicireducens]|uniref:SpoVT-AbrB domain-containing protein n=1 Tax=Amphibacillus indicireducens TaxID=1076330 RepID=A0ABP7VZF8_9BACI
MANERKVIKIGKSYGVTLPIEMLAEQGIQCGDMVEVKTDKDTITIRKVQKVSLPDGISPDFFEILEETAQLHGEALKKLVDK